MGISYLDLSIIIVFLLGSLGIGLYYVKRASKNLESYYLGGRSFPWWLSGLSMVATTFAADTPLAVTELVAQKGIAGNWLWWNMMAGGMLTTIFFAHLWWRSGILTDVELVEVRYSGAPARFLRGLKSVYLGFFMNILIIGWVNKAMEALLVSFFGLDESNTFWALAACMLLVVLYSGLSGLWGVAVTDAVQFGLAMVGCIALAFVVLDLPQVGGIDGINAKLGPTGALSFFPQVSSTGGVGSVLALSASTFFAYIGIQWWSSWYPGAEPGGGGYVAQRIMSAKSQRDATFSSLLFQIMHFCVRPWPWIIVALASVILYPGLDEPKMGYVYAMRDYLPNGLRGLLLASFLAAYMSTISAQFNWGASYLVNDLYVRFINPKSTDKAQINASRVVTFFIAFCALFATRFMDSISGVWLFMLEAGGGIGLVLILRWYWWRVNAWSELVATLAPPIVYMIIKYTNLLPADLTIFPNSFFIIVGTTTVLWLLATFATNPETDATLQAFYKRVRPEVGWRPVREALSIPKENTFFAWRIVCWLAAISLGYSILFGLGYFIFKDYYAALISLLVVVVSLYVFLVTGKKAKVWNQ